LDSYTVVDGIDVPSAEVYDEDAKETTITFTLPASVIVSTEIDVYYEHEYVLIEGGGTPFTNTYSVEFDGVNDYVTMGDMLNKTNSDAFSVSAWIKISVHSGTRYIISKFKGVNPYNGWSLSINTGHKLLFALRGTSHVIAYSDVAYFTTGVWYHVVGTYDGSGLASGLTVYLNGSDVTENPRTGTLAGSISSDAPLNISGRDNGYYPFPGNIDEVSMFNSEISASDVTTIYNGGVPADLTALSPEAWWRMGEGSTYPMLNNEQAYSNRSVEFDGVNDYVNCGNPTELQITGAISVSMWVKFTGASKCGASKEGYAGSGVRGWALWASEYGGYNPQFVIWNGNTAYNNGTSATAVSDGAWHHIVGVYEPSVAIRMYVDGSLSEENTTSIPASMNDISDNLILGRFTPSYSSGYNFNGNMDEVAIWDSVLSAANVTTIYNNGVPNDISGLNPVAYYRMGDGDTYPTLTDSGSGSNDGTMTNMTADDITGAQTTGIMTNMTSGDIETDVPVYIEPGLLFHIDAGNTESYTSPSTTCNSIGFVNTSGTLQGASGLQASPIYDSNGGGSWLFDGTDDNIDFQYDVNLELQEFTVEVWIKWNGTTGTGGIFEVMAGSTKGHFIGFYGAGTSNIKWYTQTPGWQALQSISPTPDTWYHVVCTLGAYGTSNNKKMYINGVYDTQQTTSADIQYGSSNVRIGYYDASWEGNIASVKVYNREFTPTEILENFNSTKSRFGL